MAEERKNSAEEVLITGETPKEVMEKRKEKKSKSLIGKIWDGICWTGEKLWENRGTVAAVTATVVATKVISDQSHKKELAKVAHRERNNGAIDGIMASTIEHSKLPEENKQEWYDRTGMHRSNCKNVERATRAVINEYLEEGKTSKQA